MVLVYIMHSECNNNYNYSNDSHPTKLTVTANLLLMSCYAGLWPSPFIDIMLLHLAVAV